MIYVYCMYGLGGAMFSYGIENVLARSVRKIPGVICPPTRGWGEWQQIVSAIRAQPKGSKTAVVGHSLGAVMATKVTDHVPVDLLVLYDLAGGKPSLLGKNTGKCIDIYDTFPDLVPEYRVQAVSGREKLPDGTKRIERWYSSYGHTGVDDSPSLAGKVAPRIDILDGVADVPSSVLAFPVDSAAVVNNVVARVERLAVQDRDTSPAN